MRKLVLAAVATPTVLFLLSCSGMVPTSSFDNVGACKKYVEHFNSLRCMPKEAKLVEADFCPSALDMNPNDMGPFYECLSSNSKCNGKVPDLGGQANCKM